MKRLLYLSSLALGVFLVLSCQTVPETWIYDLEDAILSGINEIRADSGSATLVMNDILADVARNHSTDMGVHDYFEHDSRDGTEFGDRIKDAGIFYTKAGENICKKGTDASTQDISEVADAVVEAWYNSEGHRINMLDGDFNQAGVGCYQADDALYVTLDLIRTPE